jgi:hypothetical protein
MHVQKNMFESLIGTLQDMKGKTKEGLNSRMDMVQLGIKKIDTHSESGMATKSYRVWKVQNEMRNSES